MERLGYSHLRQPVARREPPVVDRQAQRASRPSESDRRRSRYRYSAARLRRRAGSRQARACAARRAIPGLLDISAVPSAGTQHAFQEHPLSHREEDKEYLGRNDSPGGALRTLLWLAVLRARTYAGSV